MAEPKDRSPLRASVGVPGVRGVPRAETAPMQASRASPEPVPLARDSSGGDGGANQHEPTPVRPSVIRPAESAGRAASMVIEAVTPELDGGRSAVKRIGGEPLHVEA